MKYTCGKIDTETNKPISSLEDLINITDETKVLVCSPDEGVKLTSIGSLKALLDIRYAKNKHYDPNVLLNAIDTIFNSNSEYDPDFNNVNKKYIDDKVNSVIDLYYQDMESVKAELIEKIDELFKEDENSTP